MRFLGVTETCDLLALYIALQEEGHEVRVSVSEPLAAETGVGLVERVPDWRAELDWVGTDGIILFEAVSDGFGELQDDLRRHGYQVVGGSGFGDGLENDRAFALNLLTDLGFPGGNFFEFDSVAAAQAFIAARPARYVLKFSGASFASHDNFIGQLSDGRDVSAMLAVMSIAPGDKMVLMDFIDGVEIGVGAYFNGDKFLTPACLDWEHKRFFAGDLGELTGEMGTVATFDRTNSFFERTLKRLEPVLKGKRHVGYVNLNTIVNQEGIWPLEFTCRFGYPGFAVLAPLQKTPWGELFARMTKLTSTEFVVRAGWCVGIVMTTPPFPRSRHELSTAIGLPIILDGLTDDERRNVHLGEAAQYQGVYVTSGVYGWTAVITGVAETISDAQRAAYGAIGRIITPNARYRLDIGDRLIAADLDRCEAMGVFGRD